MYKLKRKRKEGQLFKYNDVRNSTEALQQPNPIIFMENLYRQKGTHAYFGQAFFLTLFFIGGWGGGGDDLDKWTLTVEQDPSPMTFPKMKSLGVFLMFFLFSPPSTDILNLKQTTCTVKIIHLQLLSSSQVSCVFKSTYKP